MTPQIKTCFKCNKEKPLTEFYSHPGMADGHLNKCKECTREDTKLNRQRKHYYYKEYDRKRYCESDDRKERLRQHAKTEGYKNIKKRSTLKYIANNPQKHKAHIAVRNAIVSGKLTKCPCEICGVSNVHAHHEDYSKPLDVIWLCPKHHAWIHQ